MLNINRAIAVFRFGATKSECSFACNGQTHTVPLDTATGDDKSALGQALYNWIAGDCVGLPDFSAL